MSTLASSSSALTGVETWRPVAVRRRDWDAWLPAMAAVGCVVFGLMHILNVHPTGDGLWFWYARMFREGHRLYGDMHLNLPPFFVLVTAAAQTVFGTGWLAGKVPAVLQLLAYTASLYLLSQRVPVRPALRALLLTTAFLLTLAVSYARFDDYHIPTDLGVVLSAWLLLRYRERTEMVAERGGEWMLAVLLGVMSGLSLGNRLNDGATLVAAQGVLLPLFLRRRRIAATALFAAVVPLTLVLLVLCTGDSLDAWWTDTVVRASAIKGGTGNILVHPLMLAPRQARILLTQYVQTLLIAFFVLATSVLAYVFERRRRTGTWRDLRSVGLLAGLLLVLAWMSPWMRTNSLTMAVAGLGVVVGTLLMLRLLATAVMQAVRFGWRGVDPLPLLLMLPFAQLLGAAMTSGKSPPEYTPAIGMMLLLLPVSVPRVRSGLPNRLLTAAAVVLVLYGTAMKALNPYLWHHYYNAPMFAGREWYQHPVYGPMYIETEQRQFMESLCAPVHASGAHVELMSFPYPYANYFCGVKPWHGYVQLWYDTASQATIDRVALDLEMRPPEWIIYERGLDSMWAHEWIFLRQRPLPHRKLDALVLDKLRAGEWTLTQQRCYNGADWLEIHTVPTVPGGPEDFPVPSDKNHNLCARTVHGFLP
jgi:hypothetical protein